MFPVLVISIAVKYFSLSPFFSISVCVCLPFVLFVSRFDVCLAIFFNYFWDYLGQLITLSRVFVIWPQLPEFLSFFLYYLNFEFPITITLISIRNRILSVVVKWRHHANCLWRVCLRMGLHSFNSFSIWATQVTSQLTYQLSENVPISSPYSSKFCCFAANG